MFYFPVLNVVCSHKDDTYDLGRVLDEMLIEKTLDASTIREIGAWIDFLWLKKTSASPTGTSSVVNKMVLYCLFNTAEEASFILNQARSKEEQDQFKNTEWIDLDLGKHGVERMWQESIGSNNSRFVVLPIVENWANVDKPVTDEDDDGWTDEKLKSIAEVIGDLYDVLFAPHRQEQDSLDSFKKQWRLQQVLRLMLEVIMSYITKHLFLSGCSEKCGKWLSLLSERWLMPLLVKAETSFQGHMEGFFVLLLLQSMILLSNMIREAYTAEQVDKFVRLTLVYERMESQAKLNSELQTPVILLVTQRMMINLAVQHCIRGACFNHVCKIVWPLFPETAPVSGNLPIMATLFPTRQANIIRDMMQQVYQEVNHIPDRQLEDVVMITCSSTSSTKRSRPLFPKDIHRAILSSLVLFVQSEILDRELLVLIKMSGMEEICRQNACSPIGNLPIFETTCERSEVVIANSSSGYDVLPVSLWASLYRPDLEKKTEANRKPIEPLDVFWEQKQLVEDRLEDYSASIERLNMVGEAQKECERLKQRLNVLEWQLDALRKTDTEHMQDIVYWRTQAQESGQSMLMMMEEVEELRKCKSANARLKKQTEDAQATAKQLQDTVQGLKTLVATQAQELQQSRHCIATCKTLVDKALLTLPASVPCWNEEAPQCPILHAPIEDPCMLILLDDTMLSASTPNTKDVSNAVLTTCVLESSAMERFAEHHASQARMFDPRMLPNEHGTSSSLYCVVRLKRSEMMTLSSVTNTEKRRNKNRKHPISKVVTRR